MIERTAHIRRLLGLITRHPVVAILGVRQVGKTMLARELVAATSSKATFFDLENPDTRAPAPGADAGAGSTPIHAGPDAFPLAKNIRAVPLRNIGEMLHLD